MTSAGAARPRAGVGVSSAVVLFLVYAATLAPDVTFWDAGEFIAAAHALGIPHPPGTPLYILLLNTWTKVLPLPFALATNLFSAVATAVAIGLIADFVQRATKSATMAFAAALAAGGMSSVWLNATETEVYAASLALGVLMIWVGERAGRERTRRWTYLLAYLIALAVPLHLSALVAAPAGIALASITTRGVSRRRLLLLIGVFVLAMGAGRMSVWMMGLGGVIVAASGFTRDRSLVSTSPGSRASTSDERRITHAASSHATPAEARRVTDAVGSLVVALIAISALGFLYLRARVDPAINQGDSETLRGFVDLVARRQYAVPAMWPRSAAAWVQIGNLAQYADWQAALSLGPTVYPSVMRSAFTVLFLVLGYQGAVAHWRANQRTWIAVATLLLCGSFGVLVYLNLHAGPSIGHGILGDDIVREARERDYFYVFAFWAWGVWAGIGAVAVAERWERPEWTGVVVACLPIVLNWRAVTRRVEPERSMPLAFAAAMLESTPANGVLFTMGDNDSYPLWYAQQVRRVRPDVAVVTVPLLPTDWYRRQISRRFGLLDSVAARQFDGSLATAARIASGARSLRRPIAATMMMTPTERARIGPNWIASGMVYVGADRQQPGARSIDTVTSVRIADRIDKQLSQREVRAAIDPVHDYFRRMLGCPRQLVASARSGDSTQLDSICSYR